MQDTAMYKTDDHYQIDHYEESYKVYYEYGYIPDVEVLTDDGYQPIKLNQQLFAILVERCIEWDNCP